MYFSLHDYSGYESLFSLIFRNNFLCSSTKNSYLFYRKTDKFIIPQELAITHYYIYIY